MKILFIYTDISSSCGYSAGIGVLSAILKEHGHERKLLHISDELNYPLDTQRINKDIKEYNPGLICFSITTNQLQFVKKIGKAIKESFDIPIIVGGHHPTADPDNLILEDWIDILCRGEGDIALYKLIDCMEKGISYENIPNLYVKSKDKIIKNPLISWIKDINTLPYDDYELFDYYNIVKSRRGWAEVIVTRGCPYPCTYCFNKSLVDEYKNNSKQKKLDFERKEYNSRRRTVKGTIKLLKSLKKRYTNITGFTFVDDVLAMNAHWLEEFSSTYKKEISLPYACTSQPLLFNEDVAKLLKESGCKVVKMGIESGNEQLRKLVLKRNISNEKLSSVFNVARNYGLKPQAFNMIGLPGETRENIMETIELNARLKPYIVWLSTFNPYPGTELFFYCRDNDLINESERDKIDSYRGSTMLNSKYFTSLDFVKLRVLFRWFLNKNLNNEAKDIYEENIEKFSKLSDEKWLDGSAETLIIQKDKEIDNELRKKDISHYISIKYINLFWGKEYDYDIS